MITVLSSLTVIPLHMKHKSINAQYIFENRKAVVETVKRTVSQSEHCVFNFFEVCVMVISSVYFFAGLERYCVVKVDF